MKSTTAEMVKMTVTFDDGSELELGLANVPPDPSALRGIAFMTDGLRGDIVRWDFATDTGRHLLTVGGERAETDGGER